MSVEISDLTGDGSGEPAKGGFAVGPDDGMVLTDLPRGLYVGEEGDVRVQMFDGTVLTFGNVPAGVFMPIRVRRIYRTGTTASRILGLY